MYISKDPNLTNDGASLITTAQIYSIPFPLYKGSLIAYSSTTAIDAARVVGIPSPCMFSEHKNSLMDDLSTAFPSAILEYGVLPHPFNCISHGWFSIFFKSLLKWSFYLFIAYIERSKGEYYYKFYQLSAMLYYR